MKLCKDCKHCEPYKMFFFVNIYSIAKCKHKSIASYTDGGPVKFCETTRKFGPCWSDGKLWEPKNA